MQIATKAIVVCHLHALPAQDSPAGHRETDELKDCITEGTQTKRPQRSRSLKLIKCDHKTLAICCKTFGFSMGNERATQEILGNEA